MSKPPPDELTPAQRIRLEIAPRGATAQELASLLAQARREAPLAAADFAAVARYCMFIGYPRSGHSLVGAMLDAHPNVVMAHELNALRYLAAGASRLELFWLLRRNAEDFAALGRRWGDYDYSIPGQWQGRHAEVQVIGDKKGGTSSGLLREQPQLLAQLRATVALPLRLVHVVRNPFDNIATIARKHTGHLNLAIRYYTRLVATNAALIAQAPDAVLSLRHEDVIARPAEQIARLAHFLGVAADSAWLEACASAVALTPRRTRGDIDWPPAAQRVVTALICQQVFLAGYSFDDGNDV